MGRDVEVNGVTPVVAQDYKHKQQAKAYRRYYQKSIATICWVWFSRKVRHLCEGGFR